MTTKERLTLIAEKFLNLEPAKLTVTYSQIKAQNKVTNNDWRQLCNWGFPLLDMLAKCRNVSMGTIAGMILNGAINAEDFENAVMVYTEPGGMFFIPAPPVDKASLEAEYKCNIDGVVVGIRRFIDVPPALLHGMEKKDAEQLLRFAVGAALAKAEDAFIDYIQKRIISGYEEIGESQVYVFKNLNVKL